MPTRSEEAADWFAALRRGVMTLEERDEFARWSKQCANAAAMRELEATWAMLESARPALCGSAPLRSQRHKPARAMMLAVACVASLGIGIMSYGGNDQFWTTLDWSNR